LQKTKHFLYQGVNLAVAKQIVRGNLKFISAQNAGGVGCPAQLALFSAAARHFVWRRSELLLSLSISGHFGIAEISLCVLLARRVNLTARTFTSNNNNNTRARSHEYNGREQVYLSLPACCSSSVQ
jgi:hypothetical protein